MTNIEIVQRLANGETMAKIAKDVNISVFYLHKKVAEIRVRCLCKTRCQLVAVYLRKKLIE
jgi:DNA-binding NarL/FixJ family response regulator